MAVSKAGFVYPRTAGHENDGDITWCKFVIGCPNPSTHSAEYNTLRKVMQRKMEQERIPGFVGSTDDQWAAIQDHALTIHPANIGRHAGRLTRGEVNGLPSTSIIC